MLINIEKYKTLHIGDGNLNELYNMEKDLYHQHLDIFLEMLHTDSQCKIELL